jgi:16S rRNA (guanine966-N2)-methyltransferase
MRIISGQLKGKKLLTPGDASIRPTSDRARESLFNILEHGLDHDVLKDQRVLDICCGTGALGLEALSRGAAFATFIDNNQAAVSLTKKNLQHCGMTTKADVQLANAVQLPMAKQPVALVLMDPPYHADFFASVAESLKAGGWLRKGTIISMEQDRKSPVPEVKGLELVKHRTYGKAQLCLFQVE